MFAAVVEERHKSTMERRHKKNKQKTTATEVQCTLCEHAPVYRSSTSPMLNHLKAKHPGESRELMSSRCRLQEIMTSSVTKILQNGLPVCRIATRPCSQGPTALQLDTPRRCHSVLTPICVCSARQTASKTRSVWVAAVCEYSKRLWLSAC